MVVVVAEAVFVDACDACDASDETFGFAVLGTGQVTSESSL